LKVAVICEGPSDFVVLKMVVAAQGDVERFTLLQPPKDRLTGPGPGWQGVRRFLQLEGAGLDIGVHDLVVVHVDADIRNDPALRGELAGDADDPDSLEPLCDYVKRWFSGGVSPNAVIVLPREATDAWLLAAHSNIRRPEAVQSPATALADRQIIPSDNGRPVKRTEDYERLSEALVRLIRRGSTQRLPELERFLEKLRALRRRVGRRRREGAGDGNEKLLMQSEPKEAKLRRR
jgi:hypothetical protein